MKPKLKPNRTKCSKLKCDILLSNYAFRFYLRRYTLVEEDTSAAELESRLVAREAQRQGLTHVHFSAQPEPFLTQNPLLITPEYLLTSPRHPSTNL